MYLHRAWRCLNMTERRTRLALLAVLLAPVFGCASTKETDTARTGLEQLLAQLPQRLT